MPCPHPRHWPELSAGLALLDRKWDELGKESVYQHLVTTASPGWLFESSSPAAPKVMGRVGVELKVLEFPSDLFWDEVG